MTDIQLREAITNSLNSASSLTSEELFKVVSKLNNGTNRIHFYETLDLMTREGKVEGTVVSDVRYWKLTSLGKKLKVLHAR